MSDPARESRDTPAASSFSRNPTPPARITWGTLERTGEVAPLRFSGRYEILGLIGSGGAGTVYRARDVELGEVVALKVLRREVINKPGVLDRFRDEVRLSRRITHRNVARMFDIGEHGGEKFLTMELIDGAPLSQLLGIGEQQRVLDLSRAVAIAIEICAGLSAAHEVGIVHRGRWAPSRTPLPLFLGRLLPSTSKEKYESSGSAYALLCRALSEQVIH